MKLATFLSGDIAYAFSWTMIHSFWQAGLIALVLALSLSINRNLSARVRYLHGIFALIMCVVASGATFSYLYKSIGEAHYIVQTSGVTIHYFGGFWEQTYGVLNNNIEYILAVWLIGFSVQFIRFTRDFVLALRLRHQNCSPVSGLWSQRCAQLAKRMGISKRIFIRNSSRVSSICVIGHLKPVILLPIGLLTSLDVEQVEALLLHELAHIQRNDYVVNAIQSFVRLLYFFNPAVLWISRNIDIERENACDDTAVKHCGSPTLYANSLANISELQLRLATVLAAKKTGENMLPRVKRLFSDSSGMAKSMEQFVSALIAGLLVVAMNASANDIRIPSFAAEPVTLPAQSQGSQDVVPAQQVTTNPAAETNMQHAPSANTLPTVVSGSIEGAETPDNALPTLTFSEDTHMELASPSLDFALKKATSEPVQLAATEPVTNIRNTDAEPILSPMDSPDFDRFYLAEDFSVPLKRKIYVEDVHAQFADVWLKRFRSKTSDKYQASIKQNYSEAYKAQIVKALTEGGWSVENTKDEETLIFSAKLFDLYIFAPDSSGIKQTLVALAGQAATDIHITNPNGQSFIHITDYRNTDSSAKGPLLANKATNFYYFKRLMGSWAETTTSYLDNIIKIAEQQ